MDESASQNISTARNRVEEQKLHHKLLIIQALVFVIPFLIFSLIIYEGKLFLSIPQLAMYAINLILVLAGFVILRQVFDIFHRIAETIQQVDTGNTATLIVQKDLHQLMDVTDAFNNLMKKLEKASDELNLCRTNIEKEATERLSAQKALHESESLLKSLLASTEDMIMMQDINGKILYYNAPSRYGIGKDEMVGKTPYDIFDTDRASRFMEHIQKVAITLKSESSEVQMVRHGETHWFLLLTSPVIEPVTGQVTAVTTIARNITDRKRIEENANTIRKLESVGILAGGIAHDFNNLLTAILGYIDLAKIHLDPGEIAYEKLVSVESASQQAKELTQRLISLSPGATPFRKKISLVGLINDCTAFALDSSNIKNIITVPDDLWKVEADEEQIRQVIHNLLLNAKEASSEDREITIRAENIATTSADGLPINPGKYVRLSIQDIGCGIPKANLQRIFDPYFTMKEMGAVKGMGLGLAVCHSIIQRHDGCIAVDSEEGKGTVVHIYLPALES